MEKLTSDIVMQVARKAKLLTTSLANPREENSRVFEVIAPLLRQLVKVEEYKEASDIIWKHIEDGVMESENGRTSG